MTEVVKAPKEGIFDKDGRPTRAGKHFLTRGIEQLVEQLGPVAARVSELGQFGDLAGEDEVSRAELAPGFGFITIARELVASSNTAQTCATLVPYDDTIMQVAEGNQILTGSYTPQSASSVLQIVMDLTVGGTADQVLTAGLFQDAAADAIASRTTTTTNAAIPVTLFWVHEMPSPGLDPITFALRLGTNSGVAYFNSTSGGRIGGGVSVSSIRIDEILQV